jgi:hypothetical protein
MKFRISLSSVLVAVVLFQAGCKTDELGSRSPKNESLHTPNPHRPSAAACLKYWSAFIEIEMQVRSGWDVDSGFSTITNLTYTNYIGIVDGWIEGLKAGRVVIQERAQKIRDLPGLSVDADLCSLALKRAAWLGRLDLHVQEDLNWLSAYKDNRKDVDSFFGGLNAIGQVIKERDLDAWKRAPEQQRLDRIESELNGQYKLLGSQHEQLKSLSAEERLVLSRHYGIEFPVIRATSVPAAAAAPFNSLVLFHLE